ncbi:MAG: sigma-70 family RNA polymerase sigma factor, partial [Deltaproteobacteria bacterium]|nr:sigma-70 family RNA polymerase sigma factor [Deltaproteobacteria bacterium]
ASIDEDEIISVVNLSVAEAINKFDPNRGAGIVTFLYYHLKGNLIKYIDERKKNQEMYVEELGLDFYNYNQADTTLNIYDSNLANPENELERKEENELYSRALNQLTDLERELVQLNLEEGYKVQQIAKQLGLSRSYLSKLKHQALRKICFYLGRTLDLKELHTGSRVEKVPARRGKPLQRIRAKKTKFKVSKIAKR